MRKLACLLLLLLPACLEYKIVVTTVVQPDGTLRRKITIRAIQDGKPGHAWQRLAQPDAPYQRSGDDEKGYEATAELKPGSYPSGLRVTLGGQWGEKEVTPPGLPAAEGTLDVRATDLIIGTLYRYEERIGIGTDPVKFREEMPQWLDLSLRVVLDALKAKFPDIDFGPVEARVRSEILPQVEKTVVNLHHAATSMLLELEPLSPATSPATLARSEFWPAVVREFAALGVELPKDAAGIEALSKNKEAEAMLQDLAERLADRALAALPEAQRAKVKAAIVSGELKEEIDAVGKKLYPTEEAQEKLRQDALAFVSRALGAYVVYGLFDSFDLSFRVEMPGTLLRTNGDVKAHGAAWRLDKPVLVPPALYAYSFMPKEGARGEEWDLQRLGQIAGELAKMALETRAEVERIVKKALAEGWKDDAEAPPEAQRACRLIRQTLEAAKG